MATVKDRGQLLLIGALALAISFVAIALVLNSAIYTHNLASRYDSPGDQVISVNGAVAENAGEEIRYANDAFASQGYSDVRAEYSNGLTDLEAEMAREAAVDGHVLRLADTDDTQGVRIVDEESGGSTFYPRPGATDEWTVVADARVRSFRIRDASGLESLSTTDAESLLGLSDLLSLGGLTSSFVIVFDDGTTEYRIALYDDTTIGGPTVMVHETGTSTYLTCTASSTPVSVDFTAGTFDGVPCAPLGFVEDLSGDVDVRYYYGGKITGKYRLVGDGRVDGPGSEAGPFTDRVDATNYGTHCVSDPTYYDASSSSYPRISPAIYATEVTTTYESDRVEFQGRTRVAPKEPQGVPQSPRITGITVTDNDASSADFDISVDVADPTGDLSSVTVELDDGGVITSDTDSTVAGDSATSSLSVSDSTDGTFTLRIIVTDADGNQRIVEQAHESDGDGTGCPV